MTARPAGLEVLVNAYRTACQQPVEIHPANWESALADYAILLRDNRYTSEIARSSHRLIGRDGLRRACGSISSPLLSCQALVLVMAWGSGRIDSRTIRHTGWALAKAEDAHRMLVRSAEQLKSAATLRDGSLEQAYRAWRLPGIRRSFFTKWFAFAGYTAERSWQPLILDDRVLRTLNKTLNIGTQTLAGSRLWSRRYVAYVEALHQWSAELSEDRVIVDASQLEWILFRHNGAALPTTETARATEDLDC